ncbi:hypothetical protein HYALB_00011088 [Hymenoscyphus albidus]|uniref:Uncharacterized protein n=1 Tax=Hymenoscyphus albidus TaxID=595503 RepID=A0A9N9LYV6_9HELO|nr:hypothetical protein HYALB_00011088 [Hymenoscyphus albidus]
MTTLRGPETIKELVTNWVPLTTAGPPLIVCSSSLYFVPGQSSLILAFDPYYGKFIDRNVRCLATEVSLWWDQYSTSKLVINLGPFSCPGGYSTAAISRINDYTSYAGCCPFKREYDFAGTLLPAASPGQCYSTLSSGQTFVAKKTFSGNIGSWVDTSVQVNTVGVRVIAAHVNGFMFRAESSNLPASTPASATQTGTNPTRVPSIPSNTRNLGALAAVQELELV